jgi:hypothetical protein
MLFLPAVATKPQGTSKGTPTLSIIILSLMTFTINDTQHSNALPLCSLWHFFIIVIGVKMLNVIMLNGIMLNVIMLNVIMLNVIMLNVIMLNVIMLNAIMLNVIMVKVVAPLLTARICTLNFFTEVL